MDMREKLARLLFMDATAGTGFCWDGELRQEVAHREAAYSLADAILALFAEERAAKQLEIDSADLRLWMIVEELGGIVEGFPTSRINYLQRIRELRRIESRVEQAEEDSLLMQGCNDLVIRDRAEDQAKLAAAEAREAKLREALRESRDFIDSISDVIDGEHGYRPNSAASFVGRIDALLTALATVKEAPRE